jgi:hypothetical protein
MDRRSCLRIVRLGCFAALLGILPASAQEPPATPDYVSLRKIRFLPELKGKSLAEKADILQDFLKENFFDPSGLCYSLLLITGPRQVRPMNLQDMQGINVGDWVEWYGKEALDLMKRGECMTFENSLTSAGLYLQAQVWRFMVTRSPDALVEAKRAFRSIDLVYTWGCERGKRGWLAKPYGKKSTDTSSPDQDFFVLLGLYEYYPLAPPEHQVKIVQIFKDVADYLIDSKYQVWNVSSPPEPFPGSVQNCYLNAIFMQAHVLAHHVSKDSKYATELARISSHSRWREGTFREAWRAGGEKGRKVICESDASGYYQLAAAEIMFRLQPDLFGPTAREAEEKWSEIVNRWWEYSKMGIDPNYYAHYWIDYNLDDGTWRPTGLTPLQKPLKNGCVFESHHSDVRWSDLLYRQAYVSLLVARFGKEKSKEGLKWAKTILELTDGDRLRWLIDPDGKQLYPECRWMECNLSSESPFHYLIVYYQGKALNLW